MCVPLTCNFVGCKFCVSNAKNFVEITPWSGVAGKARGGGYKEGV